MRFISVTVQTFGIGKDGVGEIVVLVCQQVNARTLLMGYILGNGRQQQTGGHVRMYILPNIRS